MVCNSEKPSRLQSVIVGSASFMDTVRHLPWRVIHAGIALPPAGAPNGTIAFPALRGGSGTARAHPSRRILSRGCAGGFGRGLVAPRCRDAQLLPSCRVPHRCSAPSVAVLVDLVNPTSAYSAPLALSLKSPSEGHTNQTGSLAPVQNVIKCHVKGKAGQSGYFPVQMNKIQPLISATCFTWAGPITAVGAPGTDVLQCLKMKLALVVSPVLEQMCHCVHLC